jgi:uncharacterized protein
MPPININTPGVYINELNEFPNSVEPVATAVPAFIGYTPQAAYQGKSLLNMAVKITSFKEFELFFGFPTPPKSKVSAVQYQPQYYFVTPPSGQAGNFSLQLTNYLVQPDISTIYYLYNSVKAFYNNGGQTAYIVSVGGYGVVTGVALPVSHAWVNPNVKLADLQNGLTLLTAIEDVTMYLFPEATLLSSEEYGTLINSQLVQASKLQNTMCLLDVMSGRDKLIGDPLTGITTFRNLTGTNGLDYAAAYYPFIGTTLMQNQINYTNLFGGQLKKLLPLLTQPSESNQDLETIINNATSAGNTLTVNQIHAALLTASADYASMIQYVEELSGVLPPTGAIAGMITQTDATVGVWQAPANVGLSDVTSLIADITDEQQETLTIDAVTGKSINAIRNFQGHGILVWGARTMDGNSIDWRYLNVRRTMIYIEQSCKLAARAYVFEPNNSNTWAAITAMINSFLTDVWKQGGLQGATAAEAFTVACGLGTTMTSDDILNGFLNVSVRVAVVHPAEFITITFQQQQAVSG